MEQAKHWPSWLRRYALSAIFLAVSVLMSLLVMEQDRTIDSQRRLIRQLFQDSLELSHMKASRIQARR